MSMQYALNCIACMFVYMHCIFIQNYAIRCHGLRLSVLNKEATYLLI